ncbi:hypothetical protein PF010_g18959 [Phytophthora fragariae]|uniref:Uncharacterized protein n=1 Tax=Phytophthora fragariae TaxID=53985 RepID=A0A6A3XHL5_9STRA|nr:hypothetical protein PF010_g18959 [Phytophthora fragariae]KAE9202702.1 hypothetical protein PF002_g21170 [Phytophthora fragariae]
MDESFVKSQIVLKVICVAYEGWLNDSWVCLRPECADQNTVSLVASSKFNGDARARCSPPSSRVHRRKQQQTNNQLTDSIVMGVASTVTQEHVDTVKQYVALRLEKRTKETLQLVSDDIQFYSQRDGSYRGKEQFRA